MGTEFSSHDIQRMVCHEVGSIHCLPDRFTPFQKSLNQQHTATSRLLGRDCLLISEPGSLDWQTRHSISLFGEFHAGCLRQGTTDSLSCWVNARNRLSFRVISLNTKASFISKLDFPAPPVPVNQSLVLLCPRAWHVHTALNVIIRTFRQRHQQTNAAVIGEFWTIDGCKPSITDQVDFRVTDIKW